MPCEICQSSYCQGECLNDDFCEHCGSTECQGECQNCPSCGRSQCECPAESPGTRVERLSKQNTETMQEAVSQALIERVFPKPRKEPKEDVEAFEERLASKRRSRKVYTDAYGGTHRRKI